MPTLARIVLCSATLCCAAAAQGPVYLPINPAGAGGGGPMEAPFSAPSMRMQVIYPLLGPGARVFGQLGMRREGLLPNSVRGGQNPGEARSFATFEIHLGQGSLATFGGDFSTNFLTAPTQVFRQPISLPAAKSWPTAPMPWAASYNFPFASSYVHLGTADLLVDLRADGGSLATGGAWINRSAYRMDGHSRLETATAWASFYTQPGCALNLQIGGSTGKTNFGVPAAAYLGATGMPASTACVVGLSGQGVRDPLLGVPVGASCQPLMITPLVTLSATTGAAGSFDIFLYRGPQLPAYVGVPIFAQAAYTDPRQSSMQLTNSTELRMPDLPDPTIRAMTRMGVPASATMANPSLFPYQGLLLRMQ